MGKQRRRRNNKKGNNHGIDNSKNKDVSSNNNNSHNSASSSPPNNNLILKIRHGDVKVRHGALSALSSTIFSPESLSKSKHIKLELIQAMAERIMDDDVPCALCAVGCIANYILFQDASQSKSDNVAESSIDDHRLETILAPILVTKMNKACNQIKAIHDQMVNVASTSLMVDQSIISSDGNVTEALSTIQQEQPKKKKNQLSHNKKDTSSTLKKLEQMTRMIMDQYCLISLSLHAFCGLVEIFSVNNSASSLLYHQRDEFLSATMNSFIISTQMIQSLASAATSSGENVNNKDPITIVNKTIAKLENEANVIADVAVYSARTIHSSSDDNPEFIKALLSCGSSWDVIVSSISNATLPTLSRLHCAGIVITTSQLIMDSSGHNSLPATFQSNLDLIVTTTVFSLLSQCTMYSVDISSALCNQIAIMDSQMQEERKDEEMENSIIKMVTDRKESARSIARRQKEMKETTEAKKADMSKDDTMQEDESGEMKSDDSKVPITDKNAAKSEETELKHEKAINAWKNACLPLKLSIEVIANLCSDKGSQELNDDFDTMDDEMGWDSDQEEKLMNTATNDIYKRKEEDVELFKKVVSDGIPDRVLSVFGTILLSLIGPNKDQIPRVALEDLFEILTKCSICLGNIVCNLNDWKSNDIEISAVWKEFFQCLTASVEGEVKFVNLKLPCQAVAALLSTMTAFLRLRPSLGNVVNEQDLDLLLSYVSLEPPLQNNQSKSESDSDDMQACSDIQKDSITILGILTSTPHPDEINERICLALLKVLSKNHGISAPLMSELLNVLMDMYSADEGDPNNHESIFRKNNVLAAFEKTVPVLKRRIREANKSSPTDVAYWKETALNASRFISYKKG